MLDARVHADRVSRMLGLGRDLAAGGAAAEQARRIVDEVRREGAYGRRLALFTCFSTRDGLAVLEALRDTDPGVRGLAFTLVPTACDDDEAAAALAIVRATFPAGKLVPLVRALRRRQRYPVVDACVEELAADPDVPAKLFARCALNASVACLERLFERVLAACSTARTRHLVVRRAGTASVVGCERLLRAGDSAVRQEVMTLMLDLGASRAAVHLDLLERVGATPHELALLAFRFPEESGVARLLALFDEHPSVALWNASGVWSRLDTAVRGAVMSRFIDASLVPNDFGQLKMLLAELAPEQRAEHEERLWEVFIARQRMATMWPPYPVVFSDLRAAPEAVRLREARRQVEAVANDPKLAHYLLDYASLLPPAEAFDRLRPYVTHDDPAYRTPASRVWLRVLLDPVDGPGALPPRDRLGPAVDFLLTHARALVEPASVLRYLLEPFDWFLPLIGGRPADVPTLEELIAIARERIGDDDQVVRRVSMHLQRLREDHETKPERT
jgi:hypothetical protein